MSYIDFVYGKFARIKSRFVWKTVGKVVGLDSKKLDLIIEDSEISMAGMAKKLNVTSRC